MSARRKIALLVGLSVAGWALLIGAAILALSVPARVMVPCETDSECEFLNPGTKVEF
jgi:hypothetical protein